jgi:serine protease Do
MKFSRLFFISVLFCLIVSAASAFLMVRFIAGNVSSSRDTTLSAGISGVGTPSDNHVLSSSFTGTLSDLESAISQIANRVSPSVVSIIVTKQVQTYKTDPFGFFYEPAGTVKRQVGGGTGFFVSKEGYILTNKHVVSDPNAEYTILLADGRELIGKVLAYDPITDLAVIRAFKTQTEPYNEAIPLSFIESQSGLRIGSFVVAIGNALAEFQNTVTFGVVSGLGRQIQAENPSGESEALSGLIQTDAAINPGNSGGPLLNIQ